MAVFDCAICVCVLVFSFRSLSHPCCHSSSKNGCPRLRHDTYQHPDCDKFSNLNSRKINISGSRSRVMLFPVSFLCFMKNMSSKSNFIDFSCKNESLTRKKNNHSVLPLPSQKSMKLGLLDVVLHKTKESEGKRVTLPRLKY